MPFAADDPLTMGRRRLTPMVMGNRRGAVGANDFAMLTMDSLSRVTLVCSGEPIQCANERRPVLQADQVPTIPVRQPKASEAVWGVATSRCYVD
jgi:hypothetical protein